MWSWRYALNQKLIMKIKYEKMCHIHCLAFRNCVRKDVAKRRFKLQCLSELDMRYVSKSFSIFNMENNRIETRVQEGKLIGIVEKSVYDDYYIAFRGIPYAKPPIGELRFKDPLPAEPWSGDRDASKHGNVPVQMNIFKREIIGDEDCLSLNVYTNKIEPSSKRAVMVWIHGSAYSVGSGDTAHSGPDYFMRKDVVLVTMNHRLGALGFLNLYDEAATGNQGVKDVIMALRWIQKNISNFGGDPENVTIFGMSSGGAIAHCLALSPLAKDLFHKAISQSCVINCPLCFTGRQPHSMNKGFLLAKILGKATTDPKVAYEFLKTIDAKKLIETEQKFLLTETEYKHKREMTFTPTLDHESLNPVFPEDLGTFISRGIEIPFLLGFVDREGSFPISSGIRGYITKENLKTINSDFKKTILPACLAKLEKISVTVEDLRSLYFGDKAISEETLMNYVDFLSDEYVCRHVMEVVDIQTKLNNNATYLYKFSYESETSPIRKVLDIRIPGVTHGEETGYLLHHGVLKIFGMSPPAVDSEDYKMINCLTQMWTDFAKTGNPTPSTNLWLPVINSQSGKYNYLDINTNLQMKTFHKGEERWDWEERINKLRR